MNATHAVAALSALAHESRLSVYRLLVESGPEGLNAGTIAERLALAPSSLSFHLRHLHRTGLITQRRCSRQLIYAADFDEMNGLIGYLTENCCGTAACQISCAPRAVATTKARKRAQRA